MRRSVIRQWPTVSWTGWCMPHTGSNYRANRCGRRRAAVGKRVRNKWRRPYFLALTPVALRAPSVSAKKKRLPKPGHTARASGPRKQGQQGTLLTDADHCFTLREPYVASLRTDRHQIGMTDRHHRNAQTGERRYGLSTAPSSSPVYQGEEPAWAWFHPPQAPPERQEQVCLIRKKQPGRATDHLH